MSVREELAAPNSRVLRWAAKIVAANKTKLFTSMALLAWFLGLSSRSLGEPDEGRYAEVAREMLVSHDWVTPSLDGFYFFDKPPLHYWATAVAYSIFGTNQLAARLWCALTGLLTIGAIGWAGRHLYGREVGRTAMAILGSALLFVCGSHLNTLDMGVTAFLTVSLACFLVAHCSATIPGNVTLINMVMWVAVALAVLSKGLIGLLFPGATLILYVLWQREGRLLARLSSLSGITVFLAVAAPWFMIMAYRHTDFLDYFFVREHLTRFLTSADHRQKPFWFFGPVVLIGLFPWVMFLPWKRRDWVSLSLISEDPATRCLIIWITLIFSFFSLSHSKLPFYILPVFPALALVLARRLNVMSLDILDKRLRVIASLSVSLAFLALLAFVTDIASIRRWDLHSSCRGLFFALAFLGAGATVGAWLMRSGKRQLALYTTAFAALLGWQAMLISIQNKTFVGSAMSVAQLMSPGIRADTHVYTVHTYLRGLPFYLGKFVTVVDHDDDDLMPEIATRNDGYISDTASFVRIWNSERDALAYVPLIDLDALRKEHLICRVLGTVDLGVIISRS